jgi:hypothetical protein
VGEHQGIHGLVLGGGSDVSIHRQVGQKRLDLGFGREEVFARPHTVETGESYDPLHRGSLSMNGVVVQTEHLSHFIKEFGLLTSCRVRHTRFPSWRPEIADNRPRAKLPENPIYRIIRAKWQVNQWLGPYYPTVLSNLLRS